MIVWIHVEHNLCDGCYFEDAPIGSCDGRPCTPYENSDGRPRIAVLEEDSNDEYVYEMGPAEQAGTCFGCELYRGPSSQRQPGACVSAKCQPDTSVSGEYEIVIAIHKRDAVMGAVPQGSGQVRNTDPATSVDAAKAPRQNLRERVYALCCVYPGVTGNEAAEKLEAKLNSVTPRFAELRKAERIKDSGLRLDGQIVWQGVTS